MPALYGAVLAISLLASMGYGRADTGTTIAKAISVVTHFKAYGEVEPIAILRVRASIAGDVTAIKAVPGTTISAGEVIARLQGPAVEAVLAARLAAVSSAETLASTARKTLGIERQKLSEHLATLDKVFRAEAAGADAEARLATANAALHAVRAETTIRAATSGQVLMIDTPDGERVTAGQVILTLQPANGLWLTASFYGADAASIRPGLHGRFQPAEGGTPVPVTVRSVIGMLQPDGGLRVGLAATIPSPAWRNGLSGTVTLDGGRQALVVVPTRALILDQGHWWVLVHTSHGDRRQSVVPGSSQGDQTAIRRGLAPGANIVVENAYLDFHRDVSKTFQQPD